MQGKIMRVAALLVAASALLAGCAQVPRQAFNAQAAKSIHKVVLARTQNQTQYDTNILGHPGMSFGLIGGLIAAASSPRATFFVAGAGVLAIVVLGMPLLGRAWAKRPATGHSQSLDGGDDVVLELLPRGASVQSDPEVRS